MQDNEIQRMHTAQSAHWWYRARRGFLQSVLEAHDIRGLPIAEIGCGPGPNLGWLSVLGPVTGVDPSEACLRLAGGEPHHRLIQADATDLPLANGEFGLVCLLDVLEHIEEDVSALEEAWRIVQPGGWLLVTVPAFSSLFSVHDLAQHHFRRYDRDDFEHKIRLLPGSVDYLSGWNRKLLPAVAVARLAGKLLMRMGLLKNPTSQMELTVPAAWLNRLLEGVLTRDSNRALRSGLAAQGRWGETVGLSWVALIRKPVG